MVGGRLSSLIRPPKSVRNLTINLPRFTWQFTSERPMTITDLVAPEAILPGIESQQQEAGAAGIGGARSKLTGQNERVDFRGAVAA